MATCVGLLTIGLAVWLWRVEKRSWMRWLGVAALGGVIAQGILGGLTVRMYQPPPVSAAHATLGQLFFSTVAAIAVFTGAWWNGAFAEIDDPRSPRVRTLTVWTVAAVFLQLVLGAAFRHKAFGIIPHLVGAAVVTAFVFMTAGALKRRFANVPALRSCALSQHSHWRAALAWCRRVLVAAVRGALPATNPRDGRADGCAHGDGSLGSRNHSGNGFGRPPHDRARAGDRGFGVGFGASSVMGHLAEIFGIAIPSKRKEGL